MIFEEKKTPILQWLTWEFSIRLCDATLSFPLVTELKNKKDVPLIDDKTKQYLYLQPNERDLNCPVRNTVA